MFNLFNSKSVKNARPSGPAGQRAYIIGDIHGCMEELETLLTTIEEHNRGMPGAKTSIIFLGDLIDRGPASQEVVQFLSGYHCDFARLIYLKGNHEEVFLKILGGDADMIAPWFGFGGKKCARSYGVEDLGQVHIDPYPLLLQLQDNVPQHHIDFLSSFIDHFVFGDFLCVHAGIRPKVKFEQQKAKDFRWIREPFLSYKKDHSHTVVHGHTIVKEAVNHGNRIALDTGAYESGVLSALCIDGDSQSFLTNKTT